MGAKISQVWKWDASKFKRFSADASSYLPAGGAPKPGDIFHQKDLARTWRSIGKKGRGAFYAGDVRDGILDVLARAAASWTAKDFDGIQAAWVEPIRASYRGHTILELPRNGQGVVALMALGILESYDLTRLFIESEASHPGGGQARLCRRGPIRGRSALRGDARRPSPVPGVSWRAPRADP